MSVSFSPGEVLISRLLCAIIKAKEIDSQFDVDFIEEALSRGYYWALKWKYPDLFPGSSALPVEVEETSNFLLMWRNLNDHVNRLDQTEKQALFDAARIDQEELIFPGFDGNNDDHYGIARFLVEYLDHTTELMGATNNSHSAGTLPMYRRMYAEYRKRLSDLTSGNDRLNALVAIFNERTHPSNRA